MTYLQTSNRPAHRRTRTIFLTVVGFVFLFAIFYFFAPNLISGVFTAIARPFWRIEFSAESGAFRSMEDILAENESLRRNISEMEIRLDTVRAVELENTELKTILGRPLSASTTESQEQEGRILAAVLERPPFAGYDELIIDIGNNMGLIEGDKVYAPGNVLIGRIGAVLAKTSKVILFSSPANQYQVLIGSGRVPATAIGRGGGQYEAQVTRDIPISEGDFVDVPSISDRPFGVVSTIISDPAEPFEIIIFAPPVNVYELRWVMVERQ